jgi:hypothetical protein
MQILHSISDSWHGQWLPRSTPVVVVVVDVVVMMMVMMMDALLCRRYRHRLGMSEEDVDDAMPRQ